MVSLVLRIFAFVCFALAAFFGPPTSPHYYRLVAAGLAFWVASDIFGGMGPSAHG